MPSYNLQVLGLNVSFKAEADHQRIEEAKDLIEQRFHQLDFRGRQISKEKLLTFLALGLADDLLQSHRDRDDMDQAVTRLLAKIDEVVAGDSLK
ncbi:MAG: cell division protein ZapA [Desulfovibrio sp.]|nr:MAG: cell division protein ZapA [Desulfovibrio sp.]